MRILVLAAFVGISLVSADMEMANANVTPFDEVDSDNNGEIDFNEFEKWSKLKRQENNEHFIRKTFKSYDADRNGKLDVSEFVPLAYELSKKPIDAAQEIFKRMDGNGDGIIDTKEVAKARKDFDEGIITGLLSIADSNQDGQLSFSEFEAQLLFTKPKSQIEVNREMAAQLLAFIDSNGDKKLAGSEIYAFANQYGSVSAEEIEKVIMNLDSNNDKFLSLRELEVLPQNIGSLINVQTPPSV